jgi:hypothetical protein
MCETGRKTLHTETRELGHSQVPALIWVEGILTLIAQGVLYFHIREKHTQSYEGDRNGLSLFFFLGGEKDEDL